MLNAHVLKIHKLVVGRDSIYSQLAGHAAMLNTS